jgi:hypothetical protein
VNTLAIVLAIVTVAALDVILVVGAGLPSRERLLAARCRRSSAGRAPGKGWGHLAEMSPSLF